MCFPSNCISLAGGRLHDVYLLGWRLLGPIRHVAADARHASQQQKGKQIHEKIIVEIQSIAKTSCNVRDCRTLSHTRCYRAVFSATVAVRDLPKEDPMFSRVLNSMAVFIFTRNPGVHLF